ncbi:Valine--pyruvate aminotransferase [Saxophila tyrrhenica]|uniref:Valine--pyruvate aminotransferase n=1 Tax=Saxophila tyrrhenica TaxID=1690608 RepID=A0AAV9NY62_9PEZI|nr:Valine--pyruvate aminotransferase [Saxophila tyrrhenica]
MSHPSIFHILILPVIQALLICLGLGLAIFVLIVLLLVLPHEYFIYQPRAMAALKSTETQINLLKGQPSPYLLPADLLKNAAAKVLDDRDIYRKALVYGPDPGYEPLRNSIAKWLTAFYQRHLPSDGTDARRICITGGASQNLGCMLNVYTDPWYTRTIWIVAPAYFLAFRIFEDAGFGGRMRAVPEDSEGVDIDFLREEIQKSEEEARKEGRDTPMYKPGRQRAKCYKHVIYCVPSFANPSSRTMSLDRRRDLVKLAREVDALVVADDVYDFLQWPAEAEEVERIEGRIWAEEMIEKKVKPFMDGVLGMKATAHLPRLVDVDRELEGGTEREGADGFGNACSNGSFSKIAGPGIRVGWVEGSERFAYGVSQTGTTCSGGAPSQLTSTYVHELVNGGKLQEFIQHTLRPAYAKRYKLLMKAIEEHLLPLGFSLPQTDRKIIGGYFTWLSLPEGLKADILATRAKADANVIIAPGSMFEVPGDDGLKFETSIRLCWAYEDEEKLEEGVKRIGEVARVMLDEAEKGEFVVVEKERDNAAEFK